MSRTKILVADPLGIFRTGVRTLLKRESDLEVVEAASFAEVAEVIAESCPDVALIDLELPPVGGVEAVRLLSQQRSTHMIVWGFEPTRNTVLDAIRVGAAGFLNKRISSDGLVRSVRGVINGEAPLSRDLATLMIEALHGLEDRDRTRERLAMLSSREREIVEYVSEGARNRQIASALPISEFTVKRHMQNILAKLGVHSRRAAGDFYRRAEAELAVGAHQVA